MRLRLQALQVGAVREAMSLCSPLTYIAAAAFVLQIDES
jgi:hypothetical protein